LAKAIVWRAIATINTFIILFIMTKQLSLSIIASWWATVINFISYYWHERIWDKISWGRKQRDK
jgi:adenylylsulfate kinase